MNAMRAASIVFPGSIGGIRLDAEKGPGVPPDSGGKLRVKRVRIL